MGTAPTRKIRELWSDDKKNKALAIYIEQDPRPDISAISEQVEVPVDTIRYWRRTDDWVAQRKARRNVVTAAGLDLLVQRMNEDRRKIFDDYRKMRETARDALEDESLEFRDKKQAADVLNMALKGLAQAVDQGVTMAFLEEVISIILEECEDDDTRQRLGRRLVDLGSAWSIRSKPK